MMAIKKRALFNLFIAATVSALFVRLFLIEDYRIASNSMFPSLLTGDLVFVSKSAFNLRLPFSSYEVVKFKRPTRSEVVAFTLPDKGIETFVKRVVASSGDKVEIRNGVLYVNGISAIYKEATQEGREVAEESGLFSYEQLPEGEPYKVQLDKKKLSNYGPVDVPPNHFFVLGDNRLDSIDSRTWGPVPYSCLKGRVAVVWMSVDENGWLRANRLGALIK